jgi:CO dehydrogenase maturation factor
MQKVAISGKGGTGKSVTTTLLGAVLQEEGYGVLILDSDESNPGLYRMLGFNRAPRDLVDFFGGPKAAVELSNKGTAQDKEIPSGGAALGEKFYLKDIPDDYLISKSGLKLASVGKITKAFEGCACPMAEVMKVFLNGLIPEENQVVLVDMEAGVEHFGRGVEKYIDTVLILVEPSFESIALAAKINLLARGSGVQSIGAVLNKIPGEQVEQRLREQLDKRGVDTFGAIPYDEQVSISCLEGSVLEGATAKDYAREMVRSLMMQ